MLMLKYLIERIPTTEEEEKPPKSKIVTNPSTTETPSSSFNNLNRRKGKCRCHLRRHASFSTRPTRRFTANRKSYSSGTLKRKMNKMNRNEQLLLPKWKKINMMATPNSKTKTINFSVNTKTKRNSKYYPNSTLELLKFSQKIQEFLSKEHFLRTH